MEKPTFSTYVLLPSSIVQSYASTSNSSPQIPAYNDLLQLQQELRGIQANLGNRRGKIGEDEEKLKNWTSSKVKGKGKERERSAVPSPAPSIPATNGSNVERKVVERKVLAKAKREGSLGGSSPDLSDVDNITVKQKNDANRKRKRRKEGVIADSDEEYSDVEQSQPPVASTSKASQPPSKSRKTAPSQAPSAAPPSAHAKPVAKPRQNSPLPLSSAAPSPAPSASSAAPSLKFKINGTPSVPAKKEKEYLQPIRKGPPQIGVADDFSLPGRPLVPPRPVSIPPVPLPKTQGDVTEDFSKVKVGAQTPFTTFLSFVDPYLRSYGEDDLAYLSQKADDLTPFIIPALGRHYTETWAEEDSLSTPPPHAHPLDPPPLERHRAEDLTEDKLAMENCFMGPITERLVSALSNQGAIEEKDDDGDEPMNAPSVPMDAVELEERVRKELRHLGVFPSISGTKAKDGIVDWSTRTDDEISTALRKCQRELSTQIGVNEARKSTLVDRVKDRMAYQEYESMRDGLEKTIESGWLKRLRGASKKKAAKEKEKKEANVETITPGEEKRVPLSETLLAAIDKRRRFVDGLELVFNQGEPGQYKNIPLTSVYDDPMAAVPPPPQQETEEPEVDMQGVELSLSRAMSEMS